MARGRSSPRVDFDFYVAPDGHEYPFDDAGMRFLETFSGDGMAPIEYRTERGPFQDGETVVDWVLRPRVIQYLHRRGTGSRSDYWDARADLVNALRPNRQLTAGGREPGRLRKILANGDRRDIHVLIESGPQFQGRDPMKLDEFGFWEVLRFVAYDPLFFDPDEKSEVYALAVATHLVFPVTLVPGPDMVFGPSMVHDTANIAYGGTWQSLPVIEIVGPAQQPMVENLTTGELIWLQYDVPAGRTVTIDLAYGVKTVVDDLGTNLIGTVSDDSDLATWHLAPDPEAPLGVNQVLVHFAGASPASSVTISWYDRFIGI